MASTVYIYVIDIGGIDEGTRVGGPPPSRRGGGGDPLGRRPGPLLRIRNKYRGVDEGTRVGGPPPLGEGGGGDPLGSRPGSRFHGVMYDHNARPCIQPCGRAVARQMFFRKKKVPRARHLRAHACVPLAPRLFRPKLGSAWALRGSGEHPVGSPRPAG